VVIAQKNGAVWRDAVATARSSVGKGRRRRLIRFAEAKARRRGDGAIRLATPQRMARNNALYPRFGYAEIGRAVENGFARVFMEMRLAG
jgi:GNAT superfamily N-acetyltransferase